jgi:hypothetical protein
MNADAPAPPRWDGQRLVFELDMEGGGRVRCAISRLALLGVTGGGRFESSQVLQRFGAARERIEAAAFAKLRERTSAPLGILHIWEDDITDPPPATSPIAMQATRQRA